VYSVWTSPALQDGNDAVDEVHETARSDGIGEVETVHSYIGPLPEFVRDLFGRPDENRAGASDADVLGQVAKRPSSRGIRCREGMHQGAHGVRLDVLESLIR